ncbi:MAG TPA: peptidoglycan bridge formation glycyltransferase FemA/FemB family protein [Alloacidobacterium sp.]|nr:peptidoglycan bridge formation glycyltransferase FemA/FemB family protein [Alloacidobacterium sp.]
MKVALDHTWQVEVDHVTRAEWAQMLNLFADSNLYQTWSYGAVRWGEGNLSHLVLKHAGEVVSVAQIRIVRPIRWKFGMAYLRWGPLYERRVGPVNPEVPVAMAAALKEEYVSKRKLFLRILPNAFDGSPRAALFQAAFSEFKPEVLTPANIYRTFVLDLAPTLSELRRNLDGRWRNKLTQSEKKGLAVISGNGSEEYRMFSRMYYEMKKRKGFESTVDVEEFARIQQELPESQRMRILICEQEGIPVAGTVCSAIGDSAIYLLGATSDAGLNSRGTYLLQWTLIQWLKENGFKWYDLGGIDPERNPGVYDFKRGLSGTDVCQIEPLAASSSVVSSAIAKAGLSVRRAIRGYKGALHLARSVSQKASGS